MNILVCVKQVPDTTEIKIDPETNTLIRAGVPSIVNPFDGYALEVAVRLKENNKGTVTALCMGPPQAKLALEECLSKGADKAFLVTDRVFGGSDTLATSYILSCAIRHLERQEGKYDLILCGKQAIDGDTGQVGPEIAEHLGYAQITYVTDLSIKDTAVYAQRESDQGYDVIEAQTPAVVTITKTAFEPRYATIKSRIAAINTEIPTISAQQIEIDETRCGLKGSPTKVKKTFTPQRTKDGMKIQEHSAVTSVEKLMEQLIAISLI